MSYREQTIRFRLGSRLTPMVRNLLIANIAVGGLQLFFDTFLIENFALVPVAVIGDFTIWQLFTYMFLHGSFFHLFFNMFALWMFGGEVERTLGSPYFLRYYIMTGLGGAFFQLIVNWQSSIPIIGASAAVYGVLIAFGVLFPHRIVTLLLFFIIPIQLKARTLVAIIVGLALVLGIQGELFGVTDNVAHFAHLGGAFVGFVLLRGRSLFNDILAKIVEFQQQKQREQELERQARIHQKRKEIDRILDRINEVGYENISSEEKEFLKKASEYLAKEENN